ncbi:MAG TPA: hypothetical protein VKP88_07245 [Candidatus Paceibacterota bacterium]|nr:hypothetical protein [Candidatus Paceibacterota bacterium]
MAKTPEKKVKDECVKILKEMGTYYFFPATHGYGRSGIPDIIACRHSIFVGIECKAGGNKLTPLQARELEAIDEAGGVTLVISERNVHHLRFWVETMTELKIINAKFVGPLI